VKTPRSISVPLGSGIALISAFSLIITNSSCDAAYVATQARGQLDLLLNAKPVARMVREEDETGRAWRWALAWSAREFAREEMSLDVTNQYERAIDIEGEAVAWVVSAAGRFDIKPYKWWFPIVGEVPYKGYFCEDDALREAERLVLEGYDVMVRPVETYSLLGFLPDPLLSSVVDKAPERIVEVVIHELAHATVYVPGRPEYNEGLANFIGRRGRQAFIAEKLGSDSIVLQQALERDADSDRYREAVMALAQDLSTFYARPGTRTEAVKARIFKRHQRQYEQMAHLLNTAAYRAAKLPANNAEVASLKVYTFNSRLYSTAYATVGGDWRAFVDLLQRSADDDQPQLALERTVRQRVAQRAGSLRVDER